MLQKREWVDFPGSEVVERSVGLSGDLVYDMKVYLSCAKLIWQR